MNILGRMWRRLWREFRPEDESEEAADLRRLFAHTALRFTAAFALLFGLVFFAFWWSGSAIRFGAARAADRAAPTWRISGTVRNALTGQPIPWATVEDDPAGRPPFFRADADYTGAYELLTLAEPHKVGVSAPGYVRTRIEVGRAWFLWMPSGTEKKDVELSPK
jgi:fatty acid desaturase